MVVGVLLAVLATRYVTNPVSTLTKGLADYAAGGTKHRIVPEGASEIRMAHAAFNDMADALDRLEKENERTQRVILQHAKLTSIGQLAAGIAHEIRNPISNIFSLTKLVQRGLPDVSDDVRADLAVQAPGTPMACLSAAEGNLKYGNTENTNTQIRAQIRGQFTYLFPQ